MIKEAIQYLINLGIAPDERFVDIQDAQGADRTFIIDEKGQRKDYNKDKFLKSINWSEEVFEVSHNLPKPDDVQLADLERAAQLAESLSSKLASLGMALRDRMKSL